MAHRCLQNPVIMYMSYLFCNCPVLRVPSGELFAQAPVDQYPGIAVEAVTDSSRYFVVRIQDETGEFFMTFPTIQTYNPFC